MYSCSVYLLESGQISCHRGVSLKGQMEEVGPWASENVTQQLLRLTPIVINTVHSCSTSTEKYSTVLARRLCFCLYDSHFFPLVVMGRLCQYYVLFFCPHSLVWFPLWPAVEMVKCSYVVSAVVSNYNFFQTCVKL